MRILALALMTTTAAASAASVASVRQAERLAAEAMRQAASAPGEAIRTAQRALAATEAFEPTHFVAAGRQGEVVEDEYLEARRQYRIHRAGLYEAVGESLARLGRHDAAARYLGRAVLLDPAEGRVLRLARSQVALGRAAAALDGLHTLARRRGYGAESLALLEQAVDLLRLPSAQAEIDRARLMDMPPALAAYRPGPVSVPAGTRLPTAEVLRLEDAATLLYVAEASCRSCSADLESLKRLDRGSLRILLVPEQIDQDRALRQVLGLYRIAWPVVSFKDAARVLQVPPRSALLVARRGWSAAVLQPPFETSLPPTLEVFTRAEVRETVPRAQWSGRAEERRPPPPPPGLMPEGLAPGEDEPPPPEFTAAVEAFRAGRPAEALRRFESLEARGDGWLLPPEARFDRALCLAALGRREEARQILLRVGDSRFQDAVDRALERVGSTRRRPSG